MVEEQPPLESLLASLNHEQLQLQLLMLAKKDLSLVEAIKSEITSLFPVSSESTIVASTTVTPQRVQVKLKSYR